MKKGKKVVAKKANKPANPGGKGTTARRAAEAAKRAEAKARALIRVIAMGETLGNLADKKLKALIEAGVQIATEESQPLVAGYVSALNLALKRAGRLSEKQMAARVEFSKKAGADGKTEIVVSYNEAPHADAEDED